MVRAREAAGEVWNWGPGFRSAQQADTGDPWEEKAVGSQNRGRRDAHPLSGSHTGEAGSAGQGVPGKCPASRCVLVDPPDWEQELSRVESPDITDLSFFLNLSKRESRRS